MAQAFSTGTLAGAGSFRCEGCGFAIALHQLDEIPPCPHCSERRFKRASIFEGNRTSASAHHVERPDWVDEAREGIEEPGDYLAYEYEGRMRVARLSDGWTRIGRSLSADIRFDDPTVSRRHALVVRQDGEARALDDRSLNGVFLNGERIEWEELRDGDQLVIGRYQLYFIRRPEGSSAAATERLEAGAA